MTEKEKEARDKIMRTIDHEFVRMEDDFDTTRTHRQDLVNKLMDTAKRVAIAGTAPDGSVVLGEDTDTALRIMTTALKALSDTEKANATAISLKLKQSEQAIASSQAAKDRMAIILAATAPGRIVETTSVESLEEHLASMFDDSILASELRNNPRDISD